MMTIYPPMHLNDEQSERLKKVSERSGYSVEILATQLLEYSKFDRMIDALEMTFPEVENVHSCT